MDLVELGGLEAQRIDELIPMDRAIEAIDCVVDDGSIRSRNGSLRAAASAIGSGTAQGVWRYRSGPAGADGRCVAFRGGRLYTITDPSSDALSDGAATTGASYFSASALVSGAQLGKNMYLASDDADGITYPMVRIKPAGTVETLKQLPQPGKPTLSSMSAMALVKFSSLSAGDRVAVGSGTIGTLSLPYGAGTDTAYRITRSGGWCQLGDGIRVQVAASTADWSSYEQIILMVSPPKPSKGGGAVLVEIGTSDGTTIWETVGQVRDDGSQNAYDGPGVAYLSLGACTAANLAKIKYLRFTQQGQGIFVVFGYVLAKRAPGVGTISYKAVFYDSATAIESVASEVYELVIGSPDSTAFPRSLIVQRDYKDVEQGFYSTTDPRFLPAVWNANKTTGMTTPSADLFAGAPTLAVAVPTALQAAGSCRFYRLTTSGWRLIGTTTWATTTTSTTFEDSLGVQALGKPIYKPGGIRSQCRAMAARGSRLVLAYEHRVYISSYVGAATSTTDPVPQFPDIAVDDSDGWAYDIAPSSAEQVQCLVNGDALYVLSNEAVYAMFTLTPNSTPYQIWRRGALGRRAAIYAEDRLWWAASDGLYTSQGRAVPEKVTLSIDRIWKTWLAPTSAVVVAYHNRHLIVFDPTLGKGLRLDINSGRWTQWTCSQTHAHAAVWRDPEAARDSLWLLSNDGYLRRWIDAATTDDGTAIPAWSYSTGYRFFQGSARVRQILADIGGAAVVVDPRKNGTSAVSNAVTLQLGADPQDVPGLLNVRSYAWRVKLSGSTLSQVRRLGVDFEPLDGRGG